MKKISERQAVRMIRDVLKKYPPLHDNIDELKEFTNDVESAVTNIIKMICNLPNTAKYSSTTTTQAIVLDDEKPQRIIVSPKTPKVPFVATEVVSKKGHKAFIQAPKNE